MTEKQRRPFLDLFNKYDPGDEEREVILSATDYTYSLNKETREIRVNFFFSRLFTKKILYQIEEKIKAAYNLTSCFIFPKYPKELFSLEYKDELLTEFFRSSSIAKGFFDDCLMEIDSGVISFKLKAGYSNLPHKADCELIISRIIKNEFDLDYEIELISDEFDMDEYNKKTKFTMLYENIVSEDPIKNAPEFEYQAKNDANSIIKPYIEDDTDAVFDREKMTFTAGHTVFDVASPEEFFGKKFSEDVFDLLVPLKSLDKQKDDLSTCGKVIFVEMIEGRKNSDILRASITVSDMASSVKLKLSGKTSEISKFEGLKPGTSLLIRGSFDYDKYEDDFVIKPKSVFLIKEIEKTDSAPEKRVELHLHTKMSTMDATIEPSDIVKLAHSWGHRAVAITDHGNLQGYPDAMLTAEKLGMKVIYGIEAYYVNDTARAVFGEVHGDFDDFEYVVFDIETTGLSPISCEIIEIGAVKYKGFEVVDRFSSFCKPSVPIPELITNLTGISDDMVMDADAPIEVVKRFIDFVGDKMLIAHNANFDMGFMKKITEDNGLPFNNPYLDTLALSRFLNPELKKHKLDNLQEYYHLEDFNHHRAFEDAEMLGKIYEKMIEKMKGEGIGNFDAMNNSMASSCDPKKLKPCHMIILVKNQVGLKNLYKLVSMSYLDYFSRTPRIPKSVLDRYREGLIIGSACSEGELYRAIVEGRKFGELLQIASYYDYLEIQPIGNNGYLIENGSIENEEKLKEINKTILSIAKKKEMPCVATGDVHFMHPYEEVFRKVLFAGKNYSDNNRSIPLYMRTTEEMLNEFDYLDEKDRYDVVIKNTNLIADMIEEIRPIPKGSYPPSLEGAEEDLNNACYEKAHRLYGDPLPTIVEERLKKELGAITEHGFSVLYIIAKRLVQNSEEKGYLVGSRGSVGSSFVATMASISEVNPLVPHYRCPNEKCKHCEFITDGSVGSGFDLPKKNCPLCGTEMVRDGHDIPFETFLGFFGDKSPDIDLNFSGDVQADAHKFTEVLFGSGNVFRAGTTSGLKDKNAYGYVKKYLEEKGITANKATETLLVYGCTGVKKTTGQHPGGIIVIPRDKDVYDFTPVQHPADGTGADTITTHFAFSYLHDTVLKLDILGHDVPTKYKMLEKYTGIDVLTVPMDDEKVMALFESPKSLGCDLSEIGVETGTLCLPEFGTKFVRQMLLDTKPKTFADLLQISGLSHGTNVWVGNAQDLIKENVCTISDVIGTRDNIMTYLIYHGMDKKMSFDIMEKVRKGKGLTDPSWEPAMKEHDVPDWYIESCKKIKYMFPKAHAAAYVISAIRLAWFKVYHPVEFYCAYFSAAPEGMDMELIMKGKEGILQVLKELESTGQKLSQKEKATSDAMQITYEILARGIEILPVDIKKSHAKYFLPENGKIRLPFITINGLGLSVAEKIQSTMEEEGVYTVEDFKVKSGVGKGVLDTLRDFNVFSDLPETNQLSMF